jgi:hypothetical protein
MWGRITVRPILRDERGRVVKFEANGRFRDLDGVTRRATKWGRTEREAETNLRATLMERKVVADSADLRSAIGCRSRPR